MTYLRMVWSPADYHEVFTRAATVKAVRAVDEDTVTAQSLSDMIDKAVRR